MQSDAAAGGRRFRDGAMDSMWSSGLNATAQDAARITGRQ